MEHTNSKFYIGFFGTLIILFSIVVCHTLYLAHCREKTMDSFCKNHYGENFSVDSWQETGNYNSYNVTCSVSSQMVMMNID